MSDKTYWVNKNVKRQISKCDLTVFDTGTTKGWVSTVLMIAIIAVIFGVMQLFMGSGWGLYLTIGGAIAGLAMFMLGRFYASKSFTEYLFEFEGKEMIFQFIGKNRVLYKCEGCVLDYVKGAEGGVKEVKTLCKPYATSAAMLDVVYDQRIRKGESVIFSSTVKATVEGKEKDVTYKIKLDRKNSMESYSVDSMTFNAYFLREGQQKIIVPIALFTAIRARGITLPADNLITLDYGVKGSGAKDLTKKK